MKAVDDLKLFVSILHKIYLLCCYLHDYGTLQDEKSIHEYAFLLISHLGCVFGQSMSEM